MKFQILLRQTQTSKLETSDLLVPLVLRKRALNLGATHPTATLADKQNLVHSGVGGLVTTGCWKSLVIFSTQNEGTARCLKIGSIMTMYIKLY